MELVDLTLFVVPSLILLNAIVQMGSKEILLLLKAVFENQSTAQPPRNVRKDTFVWMDVAFFPVMIMCLVLEEKGVKTTFA